MNGIKSMFYKDKKVVVTGGSGFIGTHFISELLKRGAKVKTHIHKNLLQVEESDRIEVVQNIDLTRLDDSMRLIDGADYVVHSAGDIANPKLVPTDFQIALNQINLITNVVEASYKCGVKGLVDINSSTGYPDRRYPIKEDEYWDDEPYISYYGYGWMRRYREKVLEHASHLSDMKIAICRGTAMFGPHDNFDLETCHVVPALINRIITEENPLVVWGSPNVVRDFLYVTDVVDGALLVLEKGTSMRPYNLGYGSTVTIEDIVNTILEVTGKTPEVVYDDTKPTTIPFRMVSTDRIVNELGFKPKMSFKQGIEETVKWFKRDFGQKLALMMNL